MADTALIDAFKKTLPPLVIKFWKEQKKPLDLSGEDLDEFRIWDATGGENYADFILSNATLRNHPWIDSLKNAVCKDTDFSGSSISGIDGTNLRGAKFNNGRLWQTRAAGTMFDENTSFLGTHVLEVDFRGSTGLDIERFKREVMKAENVTLPDGTTWQKLPT